MLARTIVEKSVRAYCIEKYLPYVDPSLHAPLIGQFKRVTELMQDRESKGFCIWDNRAAKYARNLRQIRSFLYSGLEDYALEKEKGGAAAHSRMSTLMENIIMPSLLADLEQARFHPINTALHPNDWYTDTSTGRTSNEHIFNEALVWIEWDYQMEEPSFWCAEISKPSFGFGSSEVSREEAVRMALEQAERERQQMEARLHKPYSPAELSKMHNREIRRIASCRKIPGAGKKRIVELRSLIAQPQGNLFDGVK